jgi:HAD superfamily hydrolase (TIGR01509 family)
MGWRAGRRCWNKHSPSQIASGGLVPSDAAPYNVRVSFTVRAITLDLDDTLWPFAPIGARIEQSLHDWFLEHSPATAERFPIPGMRALRSQVHADHPHLVHDLSALRRLTIERALRETGGDPGLAHAAHALFHRERNRVDFYPDALDGLQRIAARVPVLALSNGNADLAAIGIDHLFAGQLSALMHGVPKPDAGIFLAACARLHCTPGEVLHVGDDIALDMLGASGAGLRTCWIHRGDKPGDATPWPTHEPAPDLKFDSLTALADWLDVAARRSAAA